MKVPAYLDMYAAGTKRLQAAAQDIEAAETLTQLTQHGPEILQDHDVSPSQRSKAPSLSTFERHRIPARFRLSYHLAQGKVVPARAAFMSPPAAGDASMPGNKELRVTCGSTAQHEPVREVQAAAGAHKVRYMPPRATAAAVLCRRTAQREPLRGEVQAAAADVRKVRYMPVRATAAAVARKSPPPLPPPSVAAAVDKDANKATALAVATAAAAPPFRLRRPTAARLAELQQDAVEPPTPPATAGPASKQHSLTPVTTAAAAAVTTPTAGTAAVAAPSKAVAAAGRDVCLSSTRRAGKRLTPEDASNHIPGVSLLPGGSADGQHKGATHIHLGIDSLHSQHHHPAKRPATAAAAIAAAAAAAASLSPPLSAGRAAAGVPRGGASKREGTAAGPVCKLFASVGRRLVDQAVTSFPELLRS